MMDQIFSSAFWTDLYLIVWVTVPYLMWLNGIDYYRKFKQWERDNSDKKSNLQPPAVIWAPVKGIHPHYADHIRRITNQHYPDYRIVFSLESTDDPAFKFLCKRFCVEVSSIVNTTVLSRDEFSHNFKELSPGLTSIQIIIAGEAEDQGQKVQNLLAAHKYDQGYGNIIAFVDADALWGLSTLKTLVDTVSPDKVGISTGYRWIVPERNTIPSILTAGANACVATALGANWRNSGWGGAMAIKRDTFEDYNAADYLKGKVNDDCVLSKLVKKNRLTIEFCPGVTPVNLIDYNWKAAICFGRRQYSQIWVFLRIVWFYGVFASSIHLTGWLICFSKVMGSQLNVFLIILCLFMGEILRGLQRRKIARTILPSWTHDKLKYVYLWDIFLISASMAAHFACAWSCMFSRHLVWSEIHYRISLSSTKVLFRNTCRNLADTEPEIGKHPVND